MSNRIDNIVVREVDGTSRFASSLVLGAGLRVTNTPGGLPELTGPLGEMELSPSGGNDTPAITAALAAYPRVRLAPGTFKVQTPLVLPAGRTLAGSGSPITELLSTAVITLGSETAIEGLTLTGPGTAGFGAGGIDYSGSGTGPRRVRITEVRARNFPSEAIRLTGADLVVLERVTVENVGALANGIYIAASGRSTAVEMRGVVVRDTGLSSIRMENVAQAALDDVLAERSQRQGIFASGCRAVRISAARFVTCSAGIYLHNTSGAEVSGCEARDCGDSLFLDAASDVVVAGFRSLAARTNPLMVAGASTSVVVNGFLSDQSGLTTFVNRPHVSVQSDSTFLLFGALRVVNSPLGTLTYEANVTDAAGRVVFIQHNLNPAKVASGGNYASL
ncbi:MAG: right-handed parallel beta-helix repeat-containing protein [Gemmatimonadetes bacterium]|nr:right-handed parallel beta-helix repeat-containing protein [Gemmatimonadota bacterium]